VGGLPLALVLLGGYLAAPERSRFPELVEPAMAELADHKLRLELAQRRLGAMSDTAMTLREVIALSLEGLPGHVADAFYDLGAFAPQPDWFDKEAALAVTQAELGALALLIACNLVNQEGDTLSIHQVVADVAQEKSSVDAFIRHQEYYFALVTENLDDRRRVVDWAKIDSAYGQIKRAWLATTREHDRLRVLEALSEFQIAHGLAKELLDWADRCLNPTPTSRLDDPKVIAILMTYMGSAYAALGEPQKALECYQRALTGYEKVGESGDTTDCLNKAGCLNNVGRAYAALGEPQKALEYYQRALTGYEKVGNQHYIAIVQFNIGRALGLVGKAEKSLEFLLQAEFILRYGGDRLLLGRTLNTIGRAYVELGDPNKALAEYYPEARSILEGMGDVHFLPDLLTNMGAAHQALGELDEAIEYYAQAKSMLEKAGHKINLRTVSDSLGKAWIEKFNKFMKAPMNFRMAHEAIQHALRNFELAANEEMVTSLKSVLAGRYRNQPNTPARKPGRNSPCPCGSGRKYKRCCGRGP
jgi:tetratricopeptide (TPR) repeat protein